MKMNALKTKSFVVSRSRSSYPPHPNINIGNEKLENVDTMKFLGVIFDPKLTFVNHINYMTSRAASKIGIIRKASHIYSDPNINVSCFRSYVLPLLEYCSPVWAGASSTHFNSLNRIYNQAKFLFPNNGNYDLDHRRKVSSLSMFYKIRFSFNHPLSHLMPDPLTINRDTRSSVTMHPHCVAVPRSRTDHHKRAFLPSTSFDWNRLPRSVFEGSGLQSFKIRLKQNH